MTDATFESGQAAAGAGAKNGSVLFLAQTPPPHHGQSAIAALMRDAFAADAGMTVDQKWRGGAHDNEDVGKRSLAKLAGFAGLLAELALLALAGRRYDIAYLGMAPWAHTAMRDALLAGFGKLLARRTLIHVHGGGLEQILDGRGLANAMMRRLLRGTEIISITDSLAEQARASGLFRRVLGLPNMAPDPGSRPALRNTRLKIACLGNLDPRKGVLEFVDVVASLAARGLPVEAVVVGGATGQLSVADVKARAAEKGAADCIDVTGWVSERRKSALLSEADVFLYLSRHDLAPVALIEALAHGCAPIVLDIGGLREMVGPQLSGNVITAPSTGASQAALVRIERYAAEPQLLERDKERARRRYLEAFSPQTFRQRVRLLVTDPDGRHGSLPATVGTAAVTEPVA